MIVSKEVSACEQNIATTAARRGLRQMFCETCAHRKEIEDNVVLALCGSCQEEMIEMREDGEAIR